jgi:uncharacterized protein (DUF305 family)
MKRKLIAGLVIAAFAVSIATPLTYANSSSMNAMHKDGSYRHGMGANHMKQTMRDTYDRKFIEKMIPHHKMAVMMAQIELEKGKDPEARAMAQKIIAEQNKEIDQMKTWYKEWYGKDVPEDMSMMNMSEMEMLKNASDVDHMFVQMMIPHHLQAVTMARMEQSAGYHQELREFAQHIADSQMQEVQEMYRWLSTHSMK